MGSAEEPQAEVNTFHLIREAFDWLRMTGAAAAYGSNRVEFTLYNSILYRFNGETGLSGKPDVLRRTVL